MNGKILVIVGMHRSGTSLVAQWLHRCGLFIGNNLVGADIGNVQGHFEDEDFLNINENFLAERHLPTSGFVHKTFRRLSEREKQELKVIIGNKNNQSVEWGWKEPRTSLFLEDYNQLLPAAFYVVVVRSFAATVSSIVSRDYKKNRLRFKSKKGLSKIKWMLFKRKSLEKIFEKETERYLKIWIHYNEQILTHIRNLPANRFMFVSYNTLIKNDQVVFSTLKNDWDFSLNYIPFNSIYEEKLLSNVADIAQYVKDKKLLERAISIEREISFNYLNLQRQF